MHKIKIGGVPEHFNLPWHLSIEEGLFLKEDIKLDWINYPGGTGAMCEALRNSELDMAIILTEGIIKDIVDGNPSKIIQTYIQSPLIWGIYVAANSPFKNPLDLKNTKAAISRYGSGSHLMAYVNAKNNGWDTSNLKFEILKNLNGAVNALTNADADYFMWEHFTTKPLVDNGTFRLIDDCPTPWPCFVIVAREDILNHKKEQIKSIINIINTTTYDFKDIPSIDKTLAHRYNLKIEDIRQWLKLTEWSQSNINQETVQKVQNQLLQLNIIDKKLKIEEFTVQL